MKNTRKKYKISLESRTNKIQMSKHYRPDLFVKYSLENYNWIDRIAKIEFHFEYSLESI